MTALAAHAGRTVEHLIRIGLGDVHEASDLVERGLRVLLPRLPRRAPAVERPEYLLFDPKGQRVGVIPAPAGQPIFGANQPTLFLRRHPG